MVSGAGSGHTKQSDALRKERNVGFLLLVLVNLTAPCAPPRPGRVGQPAPLLVAVVPRHARELSLDPQATVIPQRAKQQFVLISQHVNARTPQIGVTMLAQHVQHISKIPGAQPMVNLAPRHLFQTLSLGQNQME